MKAIILLAWANLVTAQLLDNSNLPQCVVTCLLPTLTATGCGLIDLACICSPKNQDNIKSLAQPCLEKTCSKDDLSKAVDAINSLCRTDASQSLTTQPIASSSAAADTHTSKSNPAATTSESASSASLPAISTSTTNGGSIHSTGGSGNSKPPYSTTSTEPRNSTVLPTTTGQPDSSGSGGLSKGAAAGIGVGAGLGGIAVITGLAWSFYIQGKKAGKKSRDVEEPTGHQNKSTFNSTPPPNQCLEVEGNPIAELP